MRQEHVDSDYLFSNFCSLRFVEQSLASRSLSGFSDVAARPLREGFVIDYLANRQTKQIKLVLETRKCTHFYHYYLHQRFGLVHVRVQSWFPFCVDVCLNGREWLARQMDHAGIGYQKRGNYFVAISDPAAAQELCLQQLQTDWATRLDELLNLAHPLHIELGKPVSVITGQPLRASSPPIYALRIRQL